MLLVSWFFLVFLGKFHSGSFSYSPSTSSIIVYMFQLLSFSQKGHCVFEYFSIDVLSTWQGGNA